MDFQLSTSIFNLNGDTRLSKWQLRFYKYANLLNNSFPNLFLDHNLKLEKFHLSPEKLESFWLNIDPASSPSRALSNLFWLSLPWPKIKKDLGGAIHVLDVGCGSGNYGQFLTNKAGADIASYTGTDFSENTNWKNLEKDFPNFHFFRADSANILSHIPNQTNLFISQSAIEHFRSDLTFFRQINKFIEVASHPTLQIHLFPSAACLPLYGAHGFRQYTPKTVSRITRLFLHSKHSRRPTSILYFLGSLHCNQLHQNSITKPKSKNQPELRKSNPDLYHQKLKQSIQNSFLKQPTETPSFYALLIKTI